MIDSWAQQCVRCEQIAEMLIEGGEILEIASRRTSRFAQNLWHIPGRVRRVLGPVTSESVEIVSTGKEKTLFVKLVE